MSLSRLVSLILLALPSLALLPAAVAAADGNCQFVLGFKDLHDADPGDIGDCLDNEAHNPLNGDGLQHTTNGLEVWRKASSTTAFTNGARTFLMDSSSGKVINRDAMSRFSFEPDYAASIVPIDPSFGPEKTIKIRSALYSLPYDFITIDYLDPNFKAAATAKCPSGLLDQVMGYVGQQRSTDYLNVVDNITPNLPDAQKKNCPLEAGISCWYLQSFFSKTGSITLFPLAFNSSSVILTEIGLKGATGVKIALFMINELKITNIDLISEVAEQVSLDVALNYLQRVLPPDSPELKGFILGNAPYMMGQDKLLASVH